MEDVTALNIPQKELHSTHLKQCKVLLEVIYWICWYIRQQLKHDKSKSLRVFILKAFKFVWHEQELSCSSKLIYKQVARLNGSADWSECAPAVWEKSDFIWRDGSDRLPVVWMWGSNPSTPHVLYCSWSGPPAWKLPWSSDILFLPGYKVSAEATHAPTRAQTERSHLMIPASCWHWKSLSQEVLGPEGGTISVLCPPAYFELTLISEHLRIYIWGPCDVGDREKVVGKGWASPVAELSRGRY